MASIKTVFDKLEKDDPWSQKEKKGLDSRDKALIRNIQITRKMNKQEAIDLYASKNLQGKPSLKRLAKATRDSIENAYGTNEPNKRIVESEHKKPALKAQQIRLKKQGVKIKGWKKLEKKKLSDYLHSVKNFNAKKFKSIKTNHKKYPDATLYELQHGLKSKASRTYRMKHGLTAEYTGRIK